jgi:hypothetical protein
VLVAERPDQLGLLAAVEAARAEGQEPPPG